MLAVTQLAGFGARPQRVPLSGLALQASGVSASNLSRYNFGTVNMGTAATNRVFIVATAGQVGGGTLNSVTLAGTGLTSLAEFLTDSNTNRTAFHWGRIDAGTSGNLTVAYSATQSRAAYAVFSCVTEDGNLILNESQTAIASSNSATVSLNALAGAILAIVQNQANNSGSFTWTNLTEQTDAALESGNRRASTAIQSFTDDSNSLSLTSACSNSWANGLLAISVS